MISLDLSSRIHQKIHQKIVQNANATIQSSSDSLQNKIQLVANQAFEALKDFFICLKQSFKTSLYLSPLNIRLGFSFRAIPLKYRWIVSLTLITITTIFLGTIKYFKMPKKRDSLSDQKIYDFLNAILKKEEIKECKFIFSIYSLNLLSDENLTSELILEELSNLSFQFKELLYQTTRNQCMRIFNKESKDAFDRFWKENFQEYCEKMTQEMVNTFHITTNWQYSLLRYLDPRIVKESVLSPLPQETLVNEAPSTVEFKTLFDWFDQINWRDANSPYYLGPQTDPDSPGRPIPTNEIKSRIKQALDIAEKREARTGTPPKDDKKGLKIFYDNIENKLKACIWHLQKEEQRLQEKMDGQSYESLDAELKREFMFLCENKARLCCQIGIAGSHCPVRLTGEVNQEYTKLFSNISSSDEQDLSLEQLLIKLLGSYRLEIAQERIAIMDPNRNTHTLVAYMQSIGQPFNIPGSKDAIEHLTRFSKQTIQWEAYNFCNQYTPANLILKIQSLYKISNPFREKVQTWIQDEAPDWNKEKYEDLFLDLQENIEDKIAELEDHLVKNHPATDLYLKILRQLNPKTQVIINAETGDQVTLLELAKRLNKEEITFEDFKKHLFSLEKTKDEIVSSDYYAKSRMKHVVVVKTNLFRELHELDCNEDLAKLALSILQKNKADEKTALDRLSVKLTKNDIKAQLGKITAEEGLTNIDFNVIEDEEAFARSLKAAILVKQKSDYLRQCLEDNETGNVLPHKTAEDLLVSYRILE